MRSLSLAQRLEIVIGVVMLDQGTKWLVAHWRPEWVQFNEVAAFSQDFFGLGAGFWLVLTGVLLLGLAIFAVHSQTLAAVPTALLIGGGLSNWLDRWFFGGVRDWLTIPGTALKNNLADYILTLAVLLWLWQNLSSPPPESKKQ